MSRALPPHIDAQLARAARLEGWSLFWLVSIVGVMFLAMGSSQAMKSAWIEDTLSLLPPILFLLARRFEQKPPTDAFPFGFYRLGSLAFFLASSALAGMGGFLIYEAIHTILLQEHPTIGTVSLLGRDVWLGWVMIAALVYSVIPPVILGHMKKPLARETMDKVLFTDARMNAADWKTGLAGIAGIVGIGFGLWWADAAAAGFIALDILWDGLRNMRISVAELLDGAPRKLESAEIHPIATALSQQLGQHFPDHDVEVRETGRFVRANIVPRQGAQAGADALRQRLPEDQAWRVLAIGRLLSELPERPERPSDPRDGSSG
ncbi:MAG: cation transporter [Sedimentitalea sp.]|nr:cation transporter [Sedimentitalea sp.]